MPRVVQPFCSVGVRCVQLCSSVSSNSSVAASVYRLPTVARHHTTVEAVASACRWKGWKGQWAAASAGGGKRQKSAWALVSPDRRKRNNNGCALASAVAVGRGGNMCEQLHLRAVGIVGGKGEEKDSVCFTAGPFCPAGGVRPGWAGSAEGPQWPHGGTFWPQRD